MSGDIALHLDGAEEACRVGDALTRGDKDVLPEVGAAGGCMTFDVGVLLSPSLRVKRCHSRKAEQEECDSGDAGEGVRVQRFAPFEPARRGR